jgi:hypothetical protein
MRPSVDLRWMSLKATMIKLNSLNKIIKSKSLNKQMIILFWEWTAQQVSPASRPLFPLLHFFGSGYF